MTCSGALGAAAERLSETTGATLEYVLVDVLGPGPGEAAGVVAADHVQRRGVDVGVGREDHGHQGGLLSLRVV